MQERISRRVVASTFLAVAVAVAVATLPPVVAAPGHVARPQLDAGAVAPGPGHTAFMPSAADLAKIRRGSPLHVDDGIGLPTFLWPAGNSARVAARRGLSPANAARAYLTEYAPLYQLAPDEVSAAVIANVHDTGSGAVVVTFKREVDGIPIFRDTMRVAMNRSHELVALSGFLPGRSHLKNGGRPTPVFTLKAAQAIAAALSDYAGEPFDSTSLASRGQAHGEYVDFALRADDAPGDGLQINATRARRTWFRVVDRLEPAYYVEIDVAAGPSVDSDLYAYVISATDGRVLFRHDLTSDAVYAYRVWADTGNAHAPYDGPAGNVALPHPTGVPDGYQPLFVAPQLVSLQNGPISTNDPWLPPGATETTGNNVEAYADLVSPNGFGTGDVRATTTAPNTFDRTYATGQAPSASSNQRMAAITQLFYTINYLHDWFYDAGFDEASGNAQTSNYGRGGLENDSLRAEAQDYSGRNNANMGVPADGGRPRMQMYIWDSRAGRSVVVNAPASIAGTYASGAAQFGPLGFDLTASVVLVNDGSGTASDGCQTPFVNAAQLAGKIAFIDRGTCNFTDKVKNAQNSGALGVLMANNVSGVSPLSGTDATITIPSLMISQSDGNTIRAKLGSGVTARMTRDNAPDRDGDLDLTIVAHEWGHYISNRLIADSAGLSNNQGGSMGEGWGDFHALLMIVRPEDAMVPGNASFEGAYPVAGYSVGGGANGPVANNGPYFGLRRYPYSTDFAKNPLTFRHITEGVALPNTAPVAFGADGIGNSEVHRAGEVWATMLWECYASLLRDTGRLTFDQARDRMRSYLVAAYKLTPPSPTFLEARDAVLAAAYAGDPADYVLFWQAFARRGAGITAEAPPRESSTHEGVVESFVAGNALTIADVSIDDIVATCDADGILDNNETGHLTIAITNIGTGALSGTTATVTSSTPGVSFPAGHVVALPPSSPTQTVLASIDVALTGASSVIPIDFQISVDDPALAIAGPVTTTVETRGNADFIANQLATDDVESDHSPWTVGFDPALSTGSPWQRIAVTDRDHRWLGADRGATGDHYLISPPLTVAAGTPFSFTFSHRYSFEYDSTPVYYDGGVIEISTNGGASWVDIGASASPGYSGTLDSGENPLSARSAYVGTSPGYPNFATVSVNLGTTYSGQTVRVRFRIGTDPAVGAGGWEIDQIAFAGITNRPFDALVTHRAICDADADADGTPDASDCAPQDESVWAVPSAARDLRVTGGGGAQLSWSAPSSPGATMITYDVIRSASPASFAGAACVATNTSVASANDPTIPVGGALFYLVRAKDGCGGNLGATSAGVPRTGKACP